MGLAILHDTWLPGFFLTHKTECEGGLSFKLKLSAEHDHGKISSHLAVQKLPEMEKYFINPNPQMVTPPYSRSVSFSNSQVSSHILSGYIAG